eukprot:scaffold284202_cov15-Tisochrysis_lutea.AAC.1
MSSVASISKHDSLLPEVAPAACSLTNGNTRLGMKPTEAAQHTHIQKREHHKRWLAMLTMQEGDIEGKA